MNFGLVKRYKNIEKKAELQLKRIDLPLLLMELMGGVKRFSAVLGLQHYLSSEGEGKLIGFVPTMGALHEGHLSLIDRASEECDIVVVSIFVNPKQFNNPIDLQNYPRTIESDVSLIGDRNVIVFHPDYNQVYPENHSELKIDIGSLGTVMEGKFRPGHFDGVITVVSRLFDIVNPDKAYFGEKDFQQLAVIRFMTQEQNRQIEIVPCKVMRERSGLAMSSRNVLLTDEERQRAALIFQVISSASKLKDQYSPIELSEAIRTRFKELDFDLEYVEIVDPTTLISLNDQWVMEARICVAIYLGRVRLIDNIAV
jgi:pantoate--beta-alanine ligase